MKPDMIPRMAPAWQTGNWQKSLAAAIREPAELLKILELPDSLLPAAIRAAELFPLRVPLPYLERIEKGNPNDPLLLQVLPLHLELEPTPAGYSSDPVGDLAASPIPGLIHKYQGRVLLVTTGACAIHCRYCFRRAFPYADGSSTPANLSAIVDYIQADESIEEVILSGGDPLSLSTERLRELVKPLVELEHVRRLRIHTRLPIVLPERVDAELLDWLGELPLRVVMVVHSNHAQEIDDSVQDALTRLKHAGVELLNQSVLLRGINDDVESLKALSEALFVTHVTPYYLHQLDKINGAHHFEVTDATARALMQALAHRLPGYLLPRLVRELPGELSKQAV